MKTAVAEKKRIRGIRTNTMKTAVITAPRTIDFIDKKIPEPGPGQVRVRMEGCGICASDFPVWDGRDWFSYPRTPGSPGHEGYGIIDKLGDGIEHLNKNDRISMLSFNAYAEYDIAEAKDVIVLPSELDNVPFPGEPFGCAMNIFRRSDIQKGQTVAIIGAGFMGNLVLQLAKSRGAKVIAISKRGTSLNFALESGADVLVKMDYHKGIIDEISEITGGKMCDRVIEATGKQWPLDIGSDIIGERGKLVIAGFHQDGMRNINMQQWNWKGIDVINAHERNPQTYIQGMMHAAGAILNKKMNPFPLFTHQYSFGQLNEAFNTMKSREEGFMKALIKF